MAESEEELKSLLMKVKEESENVDLKLNIQKLRSWHPIPMGSNQSILKEISTEYSLERLMLKMKLQYFGHPMWVTVKN